jgi:hypothetical protein
MDEKALEYPVRGHHLIPVDNQIKSMLSAFLCGEFHLIGKDDFMLKRGIKKAL